MSNRDISALGLPPATAGDVLELLWGARDLSGMHVDPDRALPPLHAALDADDRPLAWRILSDQMPGVGAALTYARYLSPEEHERFGNFEAMFRYAGELHGLAGLLALRERKVLAARRLWLEGLAARPGSARLREALRGLAEQWPDPQAMPPPGGAGLTDAALLEQDRKQILDDLQRAGWGTLSVIVLKDQVADVVGFATTMVILPPRVVVDSLVSGGFSQEAIALGTREALRALLPAGPSLALAETLLTFARSLRMHHAALGATDVVVHAARAMKQIGHARGLGRALLDVGINLKDHELFYDAFRALALADRQFHETGDSGGMAASAYHRADISRRMGECAVALTFLDEGRLIPAVETAHGWVQQFRSERLLNLMALDRRSDARACIEEWVADTPQDASPFASRLSVPLAARGDLDLRDGDVDSALESFARAVANAAGEILAFRTARFRSHERANIGHVFDRALRAAAGAGAADLCLGILQLARTGSLSLSTRRRDRARTDDERLAQEHQLAAVVERAVEADRSGTDVGLLQQEAEWLIAASDFVHRGGQDYRAPGDRAGIEGLAFAVRARLGPSAVLVEYAWADDTLVALVLDSERTAVHDLRLGRDEIAGLSAAVATELEAAVGDRALAALAAALIGPVEDRLAGKTRLFVVPAEGLHNLPFHALPHRGTPLAETHLVQYLDRATVLTDFDDGSQTGQMTRESGCHALAVPDVPYGSYERLSGVTREISAVRATFANAVTSSASAASDLFAGTSAEVMHVACHALLEAGRPLLARLLFTDRPVFAFEIALASFQAKLVVLSACDTANGPASAGGRTESLATAFLGAGAREVAATLWPLDDDVAVLFFERFYAHLIGTGGSAAEAVQAAQRVIRAMPEFAHPYYWAPFVVYGGWGRAPAAP